MTREEEEKKRFEEENNVVVLGDWNQIVYPSDYLDGANTEFKGNPNNPPTKKQLDNIMYIQTHCPTNYEFTGVSSKDAWDYINAHYDEAKFYDNSNKF